MSDEDVSAWYNKLPIFWFWFWFWE